jgi:hypothetical protein
MKSKATIIGPLLSCVLATASCAGLPARAASQNACDAYGIELRSVLLPDSGQQVRVERIESPAGFSAAIFCRARRIPPFPKGHESRPAVAAVAITGDTSVVITQAKDLSRVWARYQGVQDPDTVLQALLQLLDATGIVFKSQVLRSPEQTRRIYDGSLQEQSVERVEPPTIRRVRGGFRVRIFAVGAYGLDQYDFSIGLDRVLKVKKRTTRSLLST